MSSDERFPLAPMSGLILWITVLVLPAPLVLLYLGQAYHPVLFLPGLFMLLIWAVVWLYMRPTRFEISGHELRIVWPLRELSLPRSEITGVERLSGPQFRARYGFGYRIGAGGLWGGFGLFKCARETFRFYISRQDDYVIVRSRVERPLLITPTDPDRFAAALEQ